MEAIKDAIVDPTKVYYLNMDDSSRGLLAKNQIADEYDFHVISDGYQGFTSSELVNIVLSLIESGKARGVVIILDTLKKFANLMDKKSSSSFSKLMRRFVLKGGTVIALAHTNKKPGPDGKPVYGGTSDIVDDCDCAYILSEVSCEDGVKVVEFRNIKRRGNVVDTAAYSYCVGDHISYAEILASVIPVDNQQLESFKQAEQLRSDAELISAVTACINDGVITKMKLADATAKRAGVSKRTAIKVIEKYTGDDPVLHKWNVTVKKRGAKVFTLLTPD